jgi:hypothetical protein
MKAMSVAPYFRQTQPFMPYLPGHASLQTHHT